MFSKNVASHIPCLKCNKTEVNYLHEHFSSSEGEFWVYETKALYACNRCNPGYSKAWKAAGWFCKTFCMEPPITSVQVPIPISTVGTIERAVHSSCIANKGSDYRAHGTFISHLQLLEADELMKQSLCTWAPVAMIDFANRVPNSSRMYRRGRLYRDPTTPPPPPPLPAGVGVAPSPPPGLPEPGVAAIAALVLPPPNGDCEDGKMLGTNVDEDAYGKEGRMSGFSTPVEPKVLAHQIGPDLIPTEVMESSTQNLKAGLAKRVQPLGFKADKTTIRKIEKTVNALIREVFSADKIKRWRETNPDIDEFKSRKWDTQRWTQAVDEAFADVNARIEQTFQVKINEALPAKGKAPRPIIQCGDRAQAMMNLPVKCFEELLFEYFEQASIKHVDKLGAMKRVSKHLRQRGAKIVEGDGSAWDSCCNPKIRAMTENRIIRHIITTLGDDPQVPKSWMEKVLGDMDKKYIKGKAKVSDNALTPLKVCIESIRQSGHRGTSCFNYLINLVCWLVVLCDDPQTMIRKSKKGFLHQQYRSPRTGKWHTLRYAFEGDDSAISTTEDLSAHSDNIERLWTSLGFRMKLVYVKEKMTFTGYDFLVDEDGPTGVMLPEICRNIASSSWTCSSLVKMDPSKKYEVGMNAMLARAINFKECGPFSKYFASLGLAHASKCGDMELGEEDAMRLGIQVSPSVLSDLHELYLSAEVMSDDMRRLVNLVVPFSKEQELRMLQVDFGNDPFDLTEARAVVPFSIWDPAVYSSPRR